MFVGVVSFFTLVENSSIKTDALHSSCVEHVKRLESLLCRRDILLPQLRSDINFCIHSNDYQDVWVQYVNCTPFQIMLSKKNRVGLPTIAANALAQLLAVPPYAVATIILCGASYWSDRVQSRGVSMVGVSLAGAVKYL